MVIAFYWSLIFLNPTKNMGPDECQKIIERPLGLIDLSQSPTRIFIADYRFCL